MLLDLAWPLLAAAAGLVLLRFALYFKSWGHGGGLWKLAGGLVGLYLLSFLWRAEPAARPWLLAVALLALAPWRQVRVWWLEGAVIQGLETLAEEWGTERSEDPATGLFDVARPGGEAGAGARPAWVGNVLTEMASLHPGVKTRETHRMLALVVRLEAEPPLTCALTRDREVPVYHTREWRYDTVMKGQVFGMSMGDLLDERARETGGSMEALRPVAAAGAEAERNGQGSQGGDDGDPLGPFDTVLASDPDTFRATFTEDLLDRLLETARRTTPFELNVTPTSVNICTAYCGEAAIRAHLAFLDRLAGALME